VALLRDKKIKADIVQRAIKDLEINPDKAHPVLA
jgi:hypothetical protein